MSAAADLDCKRLDASELGLLNGLLANFEEGCEGFGLAVGAAAGPGEPWGVFVRGCLCGAAWLRLKPGVPAEITALLVAKRWSGIGVGALLLGRLAQAAGGAGAAETRIRLAGGGRKLGETLEEAGFSGPDPESDDYPAGEWICRSAAPRPWDRKQP
jgi:GNAT superfamily N-acetyltransferase